ncbi:MAG: tetratricopeptide repeat protein [Bacteroidetes bacterium]|nr:tetratricopeptide repeat protein [Bacteroidota bacterium]
MKWWKLTAEQGHARAQKNLGVMYENGHGVPENYQEALNWYRRAAEQGDTTAQRNLGNMYDNGKGVPRNEQEAMRWYELIAEQGDPSDHYSLGMEYMNKRQFPNDGDDYNHCSDCNYFNVRAYAWLSVAAMEGHQLAFAQKTSLRDSFMTSSQITEAQNLSIEIFNRILSANNNP